MKSRVLVDRLLFQASHRFDEAADGEAIVLANVFAVFIVSPIGIIPWSKAGGSETASDRSRYISHY